MYSMDELDRLLYRVAPLYRDIMLDSLPTEEELIDFTISAEVEAKILGFPDTYRPRKKPYLWKKVVAIIVAATLLFASLMTVQAVREAVVNVFVTVFEVFTQIDVKHSSDNLSEPSSDWEQHFGDADFMIDGFIEVYRYAGSSILLVRYENTNEFYEIHVMLLSGGATAQILLDTEAAEIENIYINGHPAIKSDKRGEISVSLVSDTATYYITGTIAESQILELLERIIF